MHPASSGSARSLTRLGSHLSADSEIGEDAEGRKIFRPYSREILLFGRMTRHGWRDMQTLGPILL